MPKRIRNRETKAARKHRAAAALNVIDMAEDLRFVALFTNAVCRNSVPVRHGPLRPATARGDARETGASSETHAPRPLREYVAKSADPRSEGSDGRRPRGPTPPA